MSRACTSHGGRHAALPARALTALALGVLGLSALTVRVRGAVDPPSSGGSVIGVGGGPVQGGCGDKKLLEKVSQGGWSGLIVAYQDYDRPWVVTPFGGGSEWERFAVVQETHPEAAVGYGNAEGECMELCRRSVYAWGVDCVLVAIGNNSQGTYCDLFRCIPPGWQNLGRGGQCAFRWGMWRTWPPRFVLWDSHIPFIGKKVPT